MLLKFFDVQRTSLLIAEPMDQKILAKFFLMSRGHAY